MADRNLLMQEIETLPPSIIDEVYDYIGYLKQKRFAATLTILP